MNKRRIRILQQRGAKMMVKKVIFKMENYFSLCVGGND